MRDVPRGVMLHHFHRPGQTPVADSLAAEQLHQLLDRLDARLHDAGEFAHRHAAGTLPDDAMCLTFDDTLASQYEIAAPVLAERGLRAFFFCQTAPLAGDVPSQTLHRRFRQECFSAPREFYQAFFDACPMDVREQLADTSVAEYLQDHTFCTDDDRRFRIARDRLLGPEGYEQLMDRLISLAGQSRESLSRDVWMSREHVAELHAAGHVIGLHSHTHPSRIGTMSEAQQRQEYARNVEVLRHITGDAPTAVSHPCNGYTPVTLKVLSEMGVTLGFRNNTLVKRGGPLEMPRETHDMGFAQAA